MKKYIVLAILILAVGSVSGYGLAFYKARVAKGPSVPINPAVEAALSPQPARPITPNATTASPVIPKGQVYDTNPYKYAVDSPQYKITTPTFSSYSTTPQQPYEVKSPTLKQQPRPSYEQCNAWIC